MKRLLAGLAGAALATVCAAGVAAPGPEVAVSALPGAQNEPTIAIDPTDPRVLLAASNSFREGTIRLYSSTDAGVTWTTETAYPAPAKLADTCAADPWVGIDRAGRQYFSFLRFIPCGGGRPRVQVIVRDGPNAPWSAPRVVAGLGNARFDDKPSLAVDTSPASPHRNRVYVAWVRATAALRGSIRISHSDDGGRSWSPPATVSRAGREVTYPSIAVSAQGTVYVAWDNVSSYRLQISRSTDGGNTFEPERPVAQFSLVPIPHCGSGVVIRAVRATCVHANPIVSVDRSRGRFRGRVYVSYTETAISGDAGVFVKSYDSRLRELAFSAAANGVAVSPTKGLLAERRHPDQFWSHSAVDPANGTLWVCFYDTWRDRTFKSAYYSCAVSRSGGRAFSRLVKAATVASDETGPEADGQEYGDYQGLAVANGVAHPIWTDSRDLSILAEEIYTTRLRQTDVLGAKR